MTDVSCDLMDVAGFRADGEIAVRSSVARPAQSGTGLVTPAWHRFPVVAGVATLTGLDPGPAVVRARMRGWQESWEVTVPDVPSLTLVTLLDAFVEYPTAVVGQAQAARDAAVSAAGQAVAARDAAVTAASGVQAVVDNAADAVRSEVAGSASAASTSASAADGSKTAAAASADAAALSASAADASKVAAAGSAAAADASKAAAAGSATSAGSAKTAAESARDTAVTKAGEAASSATSAGASKTAAQSAAGDAVSARAGAESARDDAVAARVQAQASESAASGSASAASGARTAAEAAKVAAESAKASAQAAAASFGLTASASTLAPGSAATAVVSGTGPAYNVAFGLPAGAKGDKGDQGTGLQLSGRVATHSLLPTGLNSTTDKGRSWIVNADGLLYIWDGTAFPTSGNGLNLVGAKGDKGDTGDPGPRGYTGDVGPKGDTGATGAAGTPGTTEWSGLTGKPSTFPPTVGTGAGDAKPGTWQPAWSDVIGKPSTFAPTIGAGATQAVAGNDPRLTDTRTPSSGSVTWAKIAPDGGILNLINLSDAIDEGFTLAAGHWVFIDDTDPDPANHFPIYLAVGATAGDTLGDLLGKHRLIPLVGGYDGGLSLEGGRVSIQSGGVTSSHLSSAAVTADKLAAGVLPHDVSWVQVGDKTTRATGGGDLPSGWCAMRGFTLKRIVFRFPTADASGSTTVELRKNGTAISGTSKTVAAAKQLATAGTDREVSGLSVAIAAGDVITAHITAVGTTPGKGLSVDIEGAV